MKTPSSIRFTRLDTSQISLFDSHLGTNLSYAWKGIWKAKKWLEKWCLWKIGDGKHVRVWKDPWIPTINWPLTPLDHSLLDPMTITVDHFIDRDRLCWNIPFLYRYFTPHTIEAILKIPLSLLPHLDKLFDVRSPMGFFLSVVLTVSSTVTALIKLVRTLPPRTLIHFGRPFGRWKALIRSKFLLGKPVGMAFLAPSM